MTSLTQTSATLNVGHMGKIDRFRMKQKQLRRYRACKRKDETEPSTQHVPDPPSKPQNGPKKPRLVFTDIQRRTLLAIFRETKRPSKEMQMTISQQLGLELSTVSNFFMNARRRSIDKWKEEEQRQAAARAAAAAAEQQASLLGLPAPPAPPVTLATTPTSFHAHFGNVTSLDEASLGALSPSDLDPLMDSPPGSLDGQLSAGSAAEEEEQQQQHRFALRGHDARNDETTEETTEMTIATTETTTSRNGVASRDDDGDMNGSCEGGVGGAEEGVDGVAGVSVSWDLSLGMASLAATPPNFSFSPSVPHHNPLNHHHHHHPSQLHHHHHQNLGDVVGHVTGINYGDRHLPEDVEALTLESGDPGLHLSVVGGGGVEGRLVGDGEIR